MRTEEENLTGAPKSQSGTSISKPISQNLSKKGRGKGEDLRALVEGRKEGRRRRKKNRKTKQKHDVLEMCLFDLATFVPLFELLQVVEDHVEGAACISTLKGTDEPEIPMVDD